MMLRETRSEEGVTVTNPNLSAGDEDTRPLRLTMGEDENYAGDGEEHHSEAQAV